MGILVLHVWMFHQGDLGSPERGPLDVAISQLRLGMPLFFVLSGFLIFRPFAAAMIDRRPGPDVRRYAIRRVARILPAYWVAILIPAALLALLDHGQARPLDQLPIFLLFAQNYVDATSQGLNPPTWTIVVEVSFYVAVPIAAVAFGALTARFAGPDARRTVLTVICVVLLLIGAYVLGQCAINGPNHSPLKDSLLGRLNSFAAGMLIAVLVVGRSGRPRTAYALVLAGIALVLAEAVVRGYGLLDPTLRDAIVDTPASIGFALIIGGLALRPIRGEQVLSRGPLLWYGKLSYGLYLWHFPVIFVLRSLEWWPPSLAGALAAVMIPSTVLAMLSWSLLEKPAMAWAQRRTDPPAETRPAWPGPRDPEDERWLSGIERAPSAPEPTADEASTVGGSR